MNERRLTITRRSALRRVVLAAAGLPLINLAEPLAWAGEPAPGPAAPPARRHGGEPAAKAVIEVWLWGGPSHLDTFDPKPDAGSAFTGPLNKAIATNVPGIRLGQMLPLLAKQADKYALIRSMTHGVNGHETATYITQTGRRPGGERLVYPGFGAIASSMLAERREYRGLIPPYVVLTRSLGRFAESGFLGPRYKPFVTGGDPNQRRFAVEGVIAEGVSDERQHARRKLLHSLDSLGKAVPGDPALKQFDACEEKAYDLILGDAGKLFDLSTEPDELRDRYGRTTLGQSCLMARRLVEHGVPYVTVNAGGWDTHKQHFESMRRKLPDLDRALSTLLADLADRGHLDSTVVWCTGEFGRTPRVSWEPPWNGGRSHYGACFSALVAGGGVKGGQVIGASDAHGEEVSERPVSPSDLLATIAGQLGIDPDGPLPNPRGLDVQVMPKDVAEPGGGRLHELV